VRCIFGGVYHDTFERRADGWWFRTRRSEARLVGDLSGHLAAGGLDRGSVRGDTDA
jgi:hypothetical protein